jgi:hypothetical protein
MALGAVAVLWALVWTWLTTNVRRATVIEGCGVAPEVRGVPTAEAEPA